MLISDFTEGSQGVGATRDLQQRISANCCNTSTQLHKVNRKEGDNKGPIPTYSCTGSQHAVGGVQFGRRGPNNYFK